MSLVSDSRVRTSIESAAKSVHMSFRCESLSHQMEAIVTLACLPGFEAHIHQTDVGKSMLFPVPVNIRLDKYLHLQPQSLWDCPNDSLPESCSTFLRSLAALERESIWYTELYRSSDCVLLVACTLPLMWLVSTRNAARHVHKIWFLNMVQISDLLD